MMKKMIALSGLLLASTLNIKAVLDRMSEDVTVNITHTRLSDVTSFFEINLSKASLLATCLKKGKGYTGPISQLQKMLPLTLFMQRLKDIARQSNIVFDHSNELLGAKFQALFMIDKLLEDQADSVKSKASKYVAHEYDTKM